ncbi:hypothetical protein BV394_01840 [Brevirhabdus pacifica]|uniref:Uncharacterized protein n=1 Tax=Brevirhabdus pacifica TaxID=1267768 RepID=A0A1U7DFF5_9RHOB|nr:nucleotidyltransferase family protein [Brevirhabdus pacifica]APX88623.1 hypothetical protein BV394_01840 [Brevirhabdus pacifica]PJJ86881.1 CTP:molybdopterin cytidylyltransferase MocA [Brevirhabdus pacifica]
MSQLHALILAAGRAARMRGADKLLEEVAGVPVLRRLAEAAIAAGLPLRVVLPAPDAPFGAGRAEVLAGLPLSTIRAPEGVVAMGRSLAAGAAELPAEASGLMVLLGDMPGIGREEVRAMAQAHLENPDRILRGTDDNGRPGHPVIFPAALFPALSGLSDDRGAVAIIRSQAQPPLPVPLPGARATEDLDTPEDWERWRAGNPDDQDADGGQSAARGGSTS